jgi:diguanylate cyclase (GGDEF)-like protein
VTVVQLFPIHPGARWSASWLAPAVGLALALFMPAAGAEDDLHVSLETYGIDQGLSQSGINALVEDDLGHLWIGTQDGLNRFDGHEFLVLRRSPGGLASSSIEALSFDYHRRLWIGSNDAGLDVLHLPSGALRHFGVSDQLSHSRVGAIVLDAAGGAWLGTDAGIDHIDDALERIRPLGRTGAVVALEQRPGDTGRAYALDRDCRLWRAGVTDLTPIPLPVHMGGCIALVVEADGLWMASRDDGLLRVDFEGRLLQHVEPRRLRTGGIALSGLGRLADGRLLVGYADGAVLQLDMQSRFEARTLRFDRPPDSAVSGFFESSGGLLWIGTYTSGLQRVRPLSGAVRTEWTEGHGRPPWRDRSVRAIRRQGDGLFVGTDSGLMYRHRPGAPWQRIETFDGMSVRAIEPAGARQFWIGTQQGLWRWQIGGPLQGVDGLPDRRVDDLLTVGDTLWVATRGGLARVRNGVVDDEGAHRQLEGRFITTMLPDDAGGLWIATNESGLWRLQAGGEPRRYQPSEGGELHHSLWALHIAGRSLYAGSFSAGLFRIDLDTDEVASISERDGLSSDVVYRIVPDRDGRLWLSTNNGLSVLDPSTGIIQTLGRRDGLNNIEFNSSASWADDAGVLYFGGTQGLDVLQPSRLRHTSPPARPVIAGVRRLSGATLARGGVTEFDHQVVYANELELARDSDLLSVAMTALDLSAPGAARLRYRLGGSEDDWFYPRSARTELSISRLPPGTYRLDVQAAGRDGQYGETRTLRIRVPPPFWRHPFAYVVYALLAGALAVWLRSRIGRTVRKERERVALLNRTVAERTRQLEQANRLLRQSNEQLDVATRRDPLTHVSNRRDLGDWLERHEQSILDSPEAVRERLVFFMIDIDHFKRINDDYGHRVGDHVLVAFADRLRRLSRDQDLLVRWGGEEFLLVVRGIGVEAAATVAERVRKAIADRPVSLEDGLNLSISCSIGFAPWPFHLEWPDLGDCEQSMHLADRCLYAAKSGGRNAWVGVVPGIGPDRDGVQALLAGARPDDLPPACVRILHSSPRRPRFET